VLVSVKLGNLESSLGKVLEASRKFAGARGDQIFIELVGEISLGSVACR
jgi:hypothetical protein